MDGDDQKVQFQEYHVPRSSLEEKPKLIEWIISHSGGLIKNEKQAVYFLIGFVVIAVVISFFLVFSGSKQNTLPPKIMDDTFNQTL